MKFVASVREGKEGLFCKLFTFELKRDGVPKLLSILDDQLPTGREELLFSDITALAKRHKQERPDLNFFYWIQAKVNGFYFRIDPLDPNEKVCKYTKDHQYFWVFEG